MLFVLCSIHMLFIKKQSNNLVLMKLFYFLSKVELCKFKGGRFSSVLAFLVLLESWSTRAATRLQRSKTRATTLTVMFPSLAREEGRGSMFCIVMEALKGLPNRWVR